MPALSRIAEEAAARLEAGPHPEKARRDAETLLLHVLGKNRAWFVAHGDEELSDDVHAGYGALVERRLCGEPIQYITGECEFYGLPFRVTSDVLIPRPETEHLVETALQFATGWKHPRILDVGTGSGAIAVALAKMMPSARITAVDVSVAALKIACENARQNNIADRIEFRRSDLLAAVEAPFELIVSNPPYVSTTDGANLSVEVREYEPAQALFAGDDGLAIYRRLIPAAFAALVPGGSLLMEIGYDQSEQVAALLTEAGLQGVMFVADLQGIARVACAQGPRS